VAKPNYETHSNSEPIRACPYCDYEGKSRGLTFHVLNKSDAEHGDKHDLPDNFDAKEADIVGQKEVKMDMPEQYDINERLRYVCDYCGKVCKGEGGINVHLTQMAGDSVHPEDAVDRDPESFPMYRLDEDGELTPQDKQAMDVTAGTSTLTEVLEGQTKSQEVVPVAELKRLQQSLIDSYETTPPGEGPTALESAEKVKEIIDRYENDE